MRLDYYLIACLTCDSLHQAKAAVQRRRPFTLIELLVVVAIIAVLAAMLLPAMSKARDASQRVACLSQLRQIGIVSLEYAEANDDQFTHWYAYSSTIVPTTTHEDTWKMLVADYGLTTSIVCHPARPSAPKCPQAQGMTPQNMSRSSSGW